MSIEQSHFTRETFEHHFRGMTNSGVTEKDCTNCFVTVLLFLVLYKVFSYLSDVPSALKTRLVQQLLFKFLKLLLDVRNICIFF